MTLEESVCFARVGYLVSLNLSRKNLIKRKHRAKTNPKKRQEYLNLCLVEGMMNYDMQGQDE